MLDFKFIADEQPMHAQNLNCVGSIEWEEFEKAQGLKLIESHLDYYGKFRWISRSVQQKRDMLTSIIEVAIPNLASILKRAFAANCGLVAFGD